MSRKVEIPFTVKMITPAVLDEACPGPDRRFKPFEALLRTWWRRLEMGRSREAGAELSQQELGRREAAVWGDIQGGSPRHSPVEIEFEGTDSTMRTWAEGTFEDPPPPSVHDDDGEVDQGRRAVDSMMRRLGLVSLESFRAEMEKREKSSEKEIRVGDILRTVIRCTEGQREEIEATLGLIHWLGSIPCRGTGWGSLDILREDGEPWCSRTLSALEIIGKPWTACLNLGWPHALGTGPADAGGPPHPLLWRIKPDDDTWNEAWDELNIVELGLRMLLGKGGTGNAPDPTSAGVNLDPPHPLADLIPRCKTIIAREVSWNRISNQLRFKVIRERLGDDPEPAFYGVVYHLPYGCPGAVQAAAPSGAVSQVDGQDVLGDVHAKLDGLMRRWTSP